MALWEQTEPAAEQPARVPLLKVDDGLRAAVPADELARAQRLVVAPGWGVGPGTWTPDALDASADAFAALVVRGLITRETTIAGRRTAELLGPGDVFDPWRPLPTAIPAASRWASDSTALVAVLDGRFLAAARRWPRLFGVIHERLVEQLERNTVRSAIMGLPRVEQRILGLFWHFAERWGTVRPEGVIIQLALTHELIGQLIGAQRPTVSLALQSLANDGHLERTAAGPWMLGHDSRGALPDVRPIGNVHTAAIQPAGTTVASIAAADGAPSS
jgi:CRP/FNR family cyclic AMP-dependent transcriptional regulator